MNVIFVTKHQVIEMNVLHWIVVMVQKRYVYIVFIV